MVKFHTTNIRMINNAHFSSVLQDMTKTHPLHSWVTYFHILFHIAADTENNHCANLGDSYVLDLNFSGNCYLLFGIYRHSEL